DLTFDPALASALVTSIPGFDPSVAPGYSNLLLVDSGTAEATPALIRPSAFNFQGAAVRAVGENVVLATTDVAIVNAVASPQSPPAGTSFSAPLVAGAVSYLWNLAPALASQLPAHTADLILESAQHTSNSPTVPVLDVYAAVLRLDDVPDVPSA